jgi:hypothetical protein
MEEKTETILDIIDNIRVPGRPFDRPANEYWALLCMRHGLEDLYRRTANMDAYMRQQVDQDGNLNVCLWGPMPNMPGASMAMLTCAFHWYAVSACNYARLVGAIAYSQDKTRPLPPRYVESVMPEVLSFRDKVAAHFVWSTENRRDNHAERFASVLPAVTWQNGTFMVGGVEAILKNGDKSSSSKAILPWSLTKVHEGLRQRYWPPAKP